MKAVTHIAVVLALMGVFVALPFLANTSPQAFGQALGQALGHGPAADGIDAVSSATTILDAPSGRYTIYLNTGLHADAQELDNWKLFFSGAAAPLIMQDIACVCVKGDVAGIQMAQSLRSRLPENQMKLRVEEGALAFSKADAGRFDVLVVSDEAARAYGAGRLADNPDVAVIHR